MAEQVTFNHKVIGSSPIGSITVSLSNDKEIKQYTKYIDGFLPVKDYTEGGIQISSTIDRTDIRIDQVLPIQNCAYATLDQLLYTHKGWTKWHRKLGVMFKCGRFNLAYSQSPYVIREDIANLEDICKGCRN
jgi:hypothetical protein